MKEIIESIKLTTGFAESTVSAIMDAAIGYVQMSLRTNPVLKIDNLGTLKVIDKPERIGRNPRTGEKMTFKAVRKIKFLAHKNFLNSIGIDTKAKTEAELELEQKISNELEQLYPDFPPTLTPEIMNSVNITEMMNPVSQITVPEMMNPVNVPEMIPEIPQELLPGVIPPIPMELLPLPKPKFFWDIKAPDNSFVKVPTEDLSLWGVTKTTPIYSALTGWKLAGNIPELEGIVV